MISDNNTEHASCDFMSCFILQQIQDERTKRHWNAVQARVERQEMADRAKTERQHALYLKALQNDKW